MEKYVYEIVGFCIRWPSFGFWFLCLILCLRVALVLAAVLGDFYGDFSKIFRQKVGLQGSTNYLQRCNRGKIGVALG